jgi:uncharacterized protein (DUF488 family)
MAQDRHRIRAGSSEIGLAFTVGHGTLPAEDFTVLLKSAGIAGIADVRTAPGSRRYPHFGSASMQHWLPEAGIAYAHHKALGGWRKPLPDSLNHALRNAAFRGYADYMLTEAFARGVDALIPELERRATAIMCSESVWWRCHRRLLADYLVLVRGWEIHDLMHDGRANPHVVTPDAHTDGANVYYVPFWPPA